VDVAQDTIITEEDCHTLDGIYVTSLVESGEVIEHLADRILGRVGLEDIKSPIDGKRIVKAGQEIDEALSQEIEKSGIERVKIRSVLTCQSKRGICARCYGRDLARGRPVNLGEAVGVMAAQSIGEPGTQLTMRTFHIGGTASRSAAATTLEARSDGKIKFYNMKFIEKSGDLPRLVVIARNAEIAVQDKKGFDREKYPLNYGAIVRVPEGDKVKAGDIIAEWDPFSVPILTDVTGISKFGDILEGNTMVEKVDEVTGLSRKVIVESKETDSRPRISIKDEAGKTMKIPGSKNAAIYLLPVGANLLVNDGDPIVAGDILAKIPRETTKTKDITGGLPRVAELFEARKPKEVALITEIDGTVHFGKDSKGKRKVLIQPEKGQEREYLVPKGKHVLYNEGDFVKAGQALMDGSANPHDILRVRGEKELAKFLVDEIQEVYRLQGVRINDKHIEVIVRQMLRRVKIKEVGDTDFLIGEGSGKADIRGSQREGPGRRRKACHRGSPSAGHHEGLFDDRELHLRGLLPGDHAGADRCVRDRKSRLPARPQRERDHGQIGACRHRIPGLSEPGNPCEEPGTRPDRIVLKDLRQSPGHLICAEHCEGGFYFRDISLHSLTFLGKRHIMSHLPIRGAKFHFFEEKGSI
jgi:DNA-directed RNA polymerase subunit beta'